MDTHEGTLRGAARHAGGWHDMHQHARLRTDNHRSGDTSLVRS
jgi:hypothetical protein